MFFYLTKEGQKIETPVLAKAGLAKVGISQLIVTDSSTNLPKNCHFLNAINQYVIKIRIIGFVIVIKRDVSDDVSIDETRYKVKVFLFVSDQ